MDTLSTNLIEREKSPTPTLSHSTNQKVISSCIGAVINREHTSSSSSRHHDGHRRNRDEPKEESPDRSSSSKRLSSIIKVSERKYTVPKEMQPNKNILLKAVNDANNSVAKKSFHNESSDSNNPSSRIIKTKNSDNKLELFSQHYHHKKNEENVKRLRTGLSYRTSHYEADGDEIMNEESGRTFDTSDKRRVQIDDSDSVALRQVDTNKRELIVNPNPSDEININATSTNAEPKFIVTLNGVNEEKFLSKKRSYSDMQNENDDYEMDQQQKDGQMIIGEEYMDDDSLAASKKKLIRCTFWPMCDKGDACPFLHPNKPCTTFPNCQFGQQCHYLHPSCRYDGYCTRLDCPYTHVIKKPSLNPSPVAIKKQDSSLTIPATGKQTTEQTNVSDTATSAQIPSSTGGGPKITINKIQPLYSLVNNPPSSTLTDNVKVSPDRPSMLNLFIFC